MRRKLLKIAISMIFILVLMQTVLFASTLNLNLQANKENIKIGQEVKITVSWDMGMQAADFSILYDSEKLEYVGSKLDDNYINNSEKDELKTAWFSMDNTDKTEIEYTFKAKKSGTVEIKTKINGGFATGELQIPSKYEDSSLTIEISSRPFINIFIVIGIALIFLIFIIVIFTRKRTIKFR